MEKLPSKDQRMNDAGEIVGKNGKVASKHPFIDNQVAVFHGPNSKLWSFDMLKLARKLEKNGVARNGIWKKTGMFRNSNGDWRMEISDYGMKVKQIPAPGRTLLLKDVIDHPELFKAYPHLAKMPISSYKGNENDLNRIALGYYSPANMSISMQHTDYRSQGRTKDAWARTLVHEIQHAIQAIEKPRSAKFRGTDEKIKAELAKAGIRQTDHQIYLSYWKEVDARLVQQRLDKDRESPPVPGKESFNQMFAPTPRDTEYWQVDKEPNQPGDKIADHPSKYAPYYNDMMTILNPFFGGGNMEPYQKPGYNKGNNKGATDQSNSSRLKRGSRYRNKPGDTAKVSTPPVQQPAPVANQPAPPVKKPKQAPASNPGNKAGVNKSKGTK